MCNDQITDADLQILLRENPLAAEQLRRIMAERHERVATMVSIDFVPSGRIDGWGEENVFRCPICQDPYVHAEEPSRVESDDYSAWKAGRGNVVKVPFWCESGRHKFFLCFGFHKGWTLPFWEERVDAVEQAEIEA